MPLSSIFLLNELPLKGQNKSSKIYSQSAHHSDSRWYQKNFSHVSHMNQFWFTYLSCLTLYLVAPEFYIGELEEYKSGLYIVAVCVLGEEVCVCVCEGEFCSWTCICITSILFLFRLPLFFLAAYGELLEVLGEGIIQCPSNPCHSIPIGNLTFSNPQIK